ncbi:MAG: MFS transporter, partial [Kangiellaceae bacterium]|nr:MFS transporter [Kangiellaceae bacterium]
MLNKPNNPLKFLPLFASITAVTPLAIDMYLPAMPQIAAMLKTDINLLQNSLSVYLFAYALGMFMFGPLADSFGRKKMLIIGLLGYCIFSLLIATSQSGEEFMVYRALQAIFG